VRGGRRRLGPYVVRAAGPFQPLSPQARSPAVYLARGPQAGLFPRNAARIGT